MRFLVIPFVALAVLAAMPATGHAQSFDCTKATKPDEKAVCGSQVLSSLDSELGAYWWVIGELPMMMGERGYERDRERQFLQTRGQCGSNEQCIAAAYRSRIAEMKTTIDKAMADYCAAIQLC